jgi:hypothetical protein
MRIGIIDSGISETTKRIIVQTLVQTLNGTEQKQVVGVLEKPIVFEIKNYPVDVPAEPLLFKDHPWKERTKKQYKNKLKKNKRR